MTSKLVHHIHTRVQNKQIFKSCYPTSCSFEPKVPHCQKFCYMVLVHEFPFPLTKDRWELAEECLYLLTSAVAMATLPGPAGWMAVWGSTWPAVCGNGSSVLSTLSLTRQWTPPLQNHSQPSGNLFVQEQWF